MAQDAVVTLIFTALHLIGLGLVTLLLVMLLRSESAPGWMPAEAARDRGGGEGRDASETAQRTREVRGVGIRKAAVRIASHRRHVQDASGSRPGAAAQRVRVEDREQHGVHADTDAEHRDGGRGER